MKPIPIFPFLFLAAIGAHAQSETNGIHNSIRVQNTKSTLHISHAKQTQNVMPFQNMGQIMNADTVSIKIVPASTVQTEEILYTMPIKELDFDSRMPVHVPNPEIHYTILDKKLGGLVIDPNKY